VPVRYALEQNYPNPFNPVTTIKYSVPSAGNIKLAVFDLNGRLIKELVNSHHHTGNYIESVDMSAYASGIYIYELSSEDVSISKKMALIK
ncbi:MAG TPA: T9SS type A sorting domain-containing protein, partial [Ignavibacteria bacterium]|nr:T9SS type A sorting domain-containing protein [Ignavibacteria bacterium]